MKLQKKRILIVTAKWPYVSNSTDGGDSTLREIIDSTVENYTVDILCFRNDIRDDVNIQNVRKVLIYHDDFAMFKKYSLHNEEKFLVRLKQAEIAAIEIKRICTNYDFIIVQHIMFLLNLDNEINLLKKIILYPMFTGTSYLKSGEVVPYSYLEAEKRVLKQIKLIITPSIVERNMLIDIYGVKDDCVCVIPRAVNYKYVPKKISKNDEIRLIYIASIRMQKNHYDAMRLVKFISDRKINVKLNCVGAIQDNAIYEECKKYLVSNNLCGNVVFHGNKSQKEIMSIMSSCDINVSVSKWETFGRGIYEGMVFGLPTVVLNELECVKNAVNIGIYPCFVNNIEEMAMKIIELYQDNNKYSIESIKGMELERLICKEKVYNITRQKYKEMFI